MNKITGAKDLTEQDVKTIQELTDKGISDEAVSHITGWSKIVVSRIRRGVYAKAKEALAERRRKIREQGEPTPAEPGPEAALLREICHKLDALLKALGVDQE